MAPLEVTSLPGRDEVEEDRAADDGRDGLGALDGPASLASGGRLGGAAEDPAFVDDVGQAVDMGALVDAARDGVEVEAAVPRGKGLSIGRRSHHVHPADRPGDARIGRREEGRIEIDGEIPHPPVADERSGCEHGRRAEV